jgi:hypothetical protein
MNMGQGTQQSETNLERDQTHDRKKDESATGRDIPGGDGTVGDEQVNAIGGKGTERPTGQDHSTEHHEAQAPTGGVGAIQESSDSTADVAHIDE